jgi:hypothetical protein
MTKQFTENEMETLETMVDRTSLSDVLYALEQIALAKAEHIAANWQDYGSAALWETDARMVAKTAQKVTH